MKVGDGGEHLSDIWNEAREREVKITLERRRAAAAKMRNARDKHKTKKQRQAERDEIAAYLARVPQQEY